MKQNSDKTFQPINKSGGSFLNRHIHNIGEAPRHPLYIVDAHDRTITMANSAAREIGITENKTSELMQAREALFQAEKFALLGEMAGSVGNGLCNPLGVIKNACYYLKMKLDSGPDKTVHENMFCRN